MDAMRADSVRSVGDLDALVMRVRAPFTKADVQGIPLNSHVFIVYFDAFTGRMQEAEGIIWTEDARDAEAREHADHELGQNYAGILLWVPPLAAGEADSIAHDVVSALDLGEGVSRTDYDVVEALRSGWLDSSDLHNMLASAAEKGRGL